MRADIKRQIDRITAALSMGVQTYSLMRADETAKGHRVVRPGEVPWLPKEDWDETVVVSVDGERVRLVAILAKQPGCGAFRRLVAAIQAAGLKPCVLCPTPELAATLKRWGWREKHKGVGIESEERWEPRSRTGARGRKAQAARLGSPSRGE